MNLKDIISIGSEFIGSNSSNGAVADIAKAYNMAKSGKYGTDMNGIQAAIRDFGITKSQAQGAIDMLGKNQSMLAAVRRMNPNLPDFLKNITEKADFSDKQSVPAVTQAPPENSIGALAERLNKL